MDAREEVSSMNAPLRAFLTELVEHEMDDEEGSSFKDCNFSNPFTLAAEDLGRFYFFNYWCEVGKFPPVGEWHDRIHETSWFMAQGHKCPGKERMAELHFKFRQEIS